MTGGDDLAQARTLANHPMPPRVARLPRSRVGFPIPWFVADLDDGSRDFRIASQERHIKALRESRCWVCGDKLGRYAAFVIGPMCAVNRISADPPSHADCAIYAAKVCPFLATPQMRRREGGTPEGLVEAAGAPLLRNPGVALVWVTRQWSWFRPPMGNAGYLCRLGDPASLHWYAQGRDATRAEVLTSMESGLPALQEACQMDDNPEESIVILGEEYRRALELVPA